MGFLRLAVTSLFLSGIFVLLVAMARTPLVEFIAGREYLYTALVAHVVFALDAWMLAFAALLWALAAARLGAPLGRTAGLGAALAWIGLALLAAIPMIGQGRPVMADYVPVLMHPVFLLGLVAFFGGIALAALSFLASIRWFRAATSLDAQALGVSAVGYLVALGAVLLAGLRWGTADHATLVWGGGHLLQVVNGGALIAVWLRLAPTIGVRAQALVRTSLLGFGLSIGAAAFVYVSSVPWEHVATFFWAAMGLPLITAWLVVVGVLVRQRLRGPLRLGDSSFLLFSLVLYAAGGLIALPGMGSDTRITAHYHGVVGAVTMVYMGLTYQLFPRLGVDLVWPRLARLQPHLYGWGLLLLIAGLYLAGEAGTARKTFEAISRGELSLASALFVLGAIGTLAGGMAFVVGAGVSLLGSVSSAGAATPDRAATARASSVPLGSRG